MLCLARLLRHARCAIFHRDFDKAAALIVLIISNFIRLDWLCAICTVPTHRASSISSLRHFRCFSHFLKALIPSKPCTIEYAIAMPFIIVNPLKNAVHAHMLPNPGITPPMLDALPALEDDKDSLIAACSC